MQTPPDPIIRAITARIAFLAAGVATTRT
jgi:hypothetical protein